ncbi:MAG: NAD-dependent epimerase/dehydratase family protein [Alphaproteobacteria bacterium]|nr:NAD-dependent epimerase/dehydratase family protein [Alphaproteobacteria bacterium]
MASETFTIFGATGFIGSALANRLKAEGHCVQTPARDTPIESKPMGHIIYAIGLTADFRTRPFETIDAHIGRLQEILSSATFDSFLYLSSTRVYARASDGQEDTSIPTDTSDPSDLYNLSKLTGESLCLNCGPATRIARLSNVFGAAMMETPSFLSSVIGEALAQNHITLHSNPASAKDYVAIDDVITALIHIALNGSDRIYNVGSGANVTHGEILDRIAALTGATWSVDEKANAIEFPVISTQKLSESVNAFGAKWSPQSVIDELPDLIAETQRYIEPAKGAVA